MRLYIDNQTSMKLYIDNKTSWRTADMRKLIRGALTSMGADGFPTYTVKIAYARRGGACGGWGHYHRNSLMIALPKNGNDLELQESSILEAARVLEHEISHNQGLKHGDMRKELRFAYQDVLWAQEMILGGFTVRREAGKKKDKSPTAKAAHVDAKVIEIESKLVKLKTAEKRLRTRLSEWKRKQGYYKKRAALQTRKEDTCH